MSVSIRLARQGAKKKPFYRVVAADKRAPRDGRFIEQLGYYDPRSKVIKIDLDRFDHWVSHGGQPSQTVSHLVRRTRGGAPVAAPAPAAAAPAAAPASTPAATEPTS